MSDWEALIHQQWTEAIRSDYILERAVTKDIGWVFGVIMTLKMLLSLVTSQFFQSVEYLLDASLGPCINFETDERSLCHFQICWISDVQVYSWSKQRSKEFYKNI